MKTIKNILLVSVPSVVVILLVLEVFFRTVIPADDPPMSFFDGQSKMYRFSTERERGQTTIGRFAGIRTQWRINNEGWNYPIDYRYAGERRLIAVIGDSYVEAFQVDVDRSYPFLMREALEPEYEVYAFGKSGAPLSQYLHMSRYVTSRFDPDILVFNVVHNDYEESILQLYKGMCVFMQISDGENGLMRETEPRPDYSYAQYRRWKRAIYKSALFRYLEFNLGFKRIRRNLPGEEAGSFEGNVATDRIRRNRERVERVSDYIVRTICAENRGRKVVFVCDAHKGAIYEGDLAGSGLLWMNDMMKKICEAHGAGFLDLTPLMEDDYRVRGKKFNSEIDGHWNEYGHRFVANAVLDYLHSAD